MDPLYYSICAGALGLVVGSFLNVVIYRLPIMLNQEWQHEYQLCTAKVGTKKEENETFNLLYPASHCPNCQKPVPVWANIPLLGYLFLKGKCVSCKKSISLRYPLIEIITALISILLVQHFGFTWQSLSGLVFSWSLIALTVIDIDHQLLPDAITFPLLWIGLLLSLFKLHTNAHDAIIGAVLGYLCLWSVAKLFKIIRKKDGMGQGDFKLLAVLGAWLGWQALPALVLIAALLGLISSIGFLFTKPYSQYQNLCIPFGPYLSLAGLIMLLWGPNITAMYFNLAALPN